MKQDWVTAERERADARIADIELGLTGPDAAYWRERARDRIRGLEADRMDFGLVAHQQMELDRLVQLAGPPPVTVADRVAACVSLGLCIGLLLAVTMVQPA